MKGKVTIFLRVPIKAGNVSWGHDRRQVIWREDEEAWDGNRGKRLVATVCLVFPQAETLIKKNKMIERSR